MAFGIQNLGVINQKQSPAIWQSDFSDFPTNFIAGRILIALDAGNAGIYIDGVSNRYKIAEGTIDFVNGISEQTSIEPTVRKIGLGGLLNQNTQIELEFGFFQFSGINHVFQIDRQGNTTWDGFGVACIEVRTLAPIIPTDTLVLTDAKTGNSYKVNAEII